MKKILYISLFILLFNYGCGFTPKYKGFTGVDFILKLNNIDGDRELNNAIISQINRYKSGKDEDQIFNLELKSDFNKISVAKNSKGETTKYNLKAIIEIKLISNDETRELIFVEEFKIDKINDSVEEDNYIKIIKKDFAQSFVERLILDIRKNK